MSLDIDLNILLPLSGLTFLLFLASLPWLCHHTDRTARIGTGPNYGSGPQILLSPQWVDAMPVVLGLCFYLLLSQRAGRQESAVAVAA